MACIQSLYKLAPHEICKVQKQATASLNHLLLTRKYGATLKTEKNDPKKKKAQGKQKGPDLTDVEGGSGNTTDSIQPRFNPINIQMLSKPLWKQIFQDNIAEDSKAQEKKVKKSIKHLEKHNLWGKQSSVLSEVDFKLPELYGNNIDEHFRILAKQQSQEYLDLAKQLVQTKLPAMPSEWVRKQGWTKYDSDGTTTSVNFPEDRALIFDVEVCLSEGNFPTLAVAVSPNAWYSWCSERLLEDRFSWAQKQNTKDLIPLETVGNSNKPVNGEWLSRLVIGHNVSFDRSFVKEQYLMKGPKTRFLDTMSLHMAISGLTSFQRVLWTYHRKNKNLGNQEVQEHIKKSHQRIAGPPVTDWINVSSPNNLGDVHSLYCGGKPLDKAEREIFVTGSMQDIRENFQDLMSYCAKDVKATHDIFLKILPLFFERFPHPVTFAAMLEMGQAYLPVNENWERYLRDSQGTYEDLQKEMKQTLMQLANDACHLLHNDRFKEDPWLWELDWSSVDLKFRKSKENNSNGKKRTTTKKNRKSSVKAEDTDECMTNNINDENPFAAVGAKLSNDPLNMDMQKRSFSHSSVNSGEMDDASLQGISSIQSLPFKGKSYKTFSSTALSGKVKTKHGDVQEETEEDRISRILATSELLYKKRQHMAGYPNWYRELCPKSRDNPEWRPGPSLISSQIRVTPKLLRLTWDGYPLHYDAKHGWGYLVPGRTSNLPKKIDKKVDELEHEIAIEDCSLADTDKSKEKKVDFPLRALRKLLRSVGKSRNKAELSLLEASDLREDLDLTEDEIFAQIEKLGNGNGNGESEKIWQMTKTLKMSEKQRRLHGDNDAPSWHVGNGPHNDINIPGCWFFKMPHKDGAHKNVGNPLAKDFLAKMEDGTLSSYGGAQANRILEINKMISFWRNSQDRISSQLVVWLEKSDLPNTVSRHTEYDEENSYGAIIPRVITAGTVTRRAVEQTWLTASNARADRVGSELKAMVQAPPGYHFVGADVDSQELWIASLLGDAKFAGFHGCTAFGWMTLQGNKSDRTDLHSKTADTINISRDQAKVFNYGRIYGAGQPFAVRLLMQFNHRMSPEEAKQKALTMYKATKGVKKYKLRQDVREVIKKVLNRTKQPRWVTLEELKKIRRQLRAMLDCASRDDISDNINLIEMIDLNSISLTETKEWKIGSESEMFNKLESIALSEEPTTPVLECRISRALEPQSVSTEFLTSRVNWVVQSSAVDYLHLMLVAMKWLLDKYNIDGRFSISIHDEVRYLVNSDDKYRAAMALQIANLLTRCMFAYKVGMHDLPQSVAFFSAVDIDTVLRKESHMDCKTPSNPHGLTRGYGIPPGEALDIYEILKLTNNGRLEKHKGSARKSQKSPTVQASNVD
ncbi:DNA polymerase subunit gamma-1-like [Ptychodera flava]|uniref:DNA polymerase subunit gamma-1-like n=1 Tax=Ptychodera flava TaxID=63121 RepID=UPI00396A5F18